MLHDDWKTVVARQDISDSLARLRLCGYGAINVDILSIYCFLTMNDIEGAP